MKKRYICTMMLFLVFILMGQPAIAKLAVTPPQQMIDNAN
ncbi:MAG: hypothetical protein JWM44_238 [Bacilli bacterium]|nr:hypothetical protein [Bacilli bacterium]